MEDQSSPTVKRRNFRKIWFIGVVVIAGIVLSSFAIWCSKQPKPLLPSAIAARAKGFMPYFYFDKIPAGYSLDQAQISFDDNILIAPLTKPGGPTIVLTEQLMPENLSREELQYNGEKVEGTPGRATINDIEGRLVGTMVVSGPKVLILLNAPENTDKDDLSALLQGLKTVR